MTRRKNGQKNVNSSADFFPRKGKKKRRESAANHCVLYCLVVHSLAMSQKPRPEGTFHASSTSLEKFTLEAAHRPFHSVGSRLRTSAKRVVATDPTTTATAPQRSRTNGLIHRPASATVLWGKDPHNKSERSSRASVYVFTPTTEEASTTTLIDNHQVKPRPTTTTTSHSLNLTSRTSSAQHANSLKRASLAAVAVSPSASPPHSATPLKSVQRREMRSTSAHINDEDTAITVKFTPSKANPIPSQQGRITPTKSRDSLHHQDDPDSIPLPSRSLTPITPRPSAASSITYSRSSSSASASTSTSSHRADLHTPSVQDKRHDWQQEQQHRSRQSRSSLLDDSTINGNDNDNDNGNDNDFELEAMLEEAYIEGQHQYLQSAQSVEKRKRRRSSSAQFTSSSQRPHSRFSSTSTAKPRAPVVTFTGSKRRRGLAGSQANNEEDNVEDEKEWARRHGFYFLKDADSEGDGDGDDEREYDEEEEEESSEGYDGDDKEEDFDITKRSVSVPPRTTTTRASRRCDSSASTSTSTSSSTAVTPTLPSPAAVVMRPTRASQNTDPANKDKGVHDNDNDDDGDDDKVFVTLESNSEDETEACSPKRNQHIYDPDDGHHSDGAFASTSTSIAAGSTTRARNQTLAATRSHRNNKNNHDDDDDDSDADVGHGKMTQKHKNTKVVRVSKQKLRSKQKHMEPQHTRKNNPASTKGRKAAKKKGFDEIVESEEMRRCREFYAQIDSMKTGEVFRLRPTDDWYINVTKEI